MLQLRESSQAGGQPHPELHKNGLKVATRRLLTGSSVNSASIPPGRKSQHGWLGAEIRPNKVLGEKSLGSETLYTFTGLNRESRGRP